MSLEAISKLMIVWFDFAHHRLRRACPEPGRRAQHERHNVNVFTGLSVRPEHVEG